MKAYKLTVIVVDHDEIGGEDIAETIENANYPNDCIMPSVSDIVEYEIGEWDDEHPANFIGFNADDLERLYGNNKVKS